MKSANCSISFRMEARNKYSSRNSEQSCSAKDWNYCPAFAMATDADCDCRCAGPSCLWNVEFPSLCEYQVHYPMLWLAFDGGRSDRNLLLNSKTGRSFTTVITFQDGAKAQLRFGEFLRGQAF